MKPREYYILLALVDEPRHGLAIARLVQQASDDAIKLWPATLYGTLDDLVTRGWIEEMAEHPNHESEKKRFYMLTRAGRKTVAAETDRLAALVKSARSRLRRAGVTS